MKGAVIIRNINYTSKDLHLVLKGLYKAKPKRITIKSILEKHNIHHDVFDEEQIREELESKNLITDTTDSIHGINWVMSHEKITNLFLRWFKIH